MSLTFEKYNELIKGITIGKKLPDAIYVHKLALETLPSTLANLAKNISKGLKIEDDDWNIVKFQKRDFKIAFLLYSDFDSYAYPALNYSISIDLEKLSHRKADYTSSSNPPILHRKETFVENTYPNYQLFTEITEEGERAGLYENTRKIGFKLQWEKLIHSKGYFLDETGRLIQSAEKSFNEAVDLSDRQIDRHLTAIERNKLSVPMQLLAKHGYLDGDFSILDYGCGRGDDARELEAHGLDVSSWDPVHHPEGQLIESDLVNLGFVINVIEDVEERSQTLEKAWGYADKALVVSVMVAGDAVIEQFQPYKDGVITSRNTFQKYFSQGQFKEYVESTLNENAIAFGQGIFILFKDKMEEQSFLVERQNTRKQWRNLTFDTKPKPDEIEKNKKVIFNNQELFNDFWHLCLEIGRIPANYEFDFSEDIRRLVGSHNKAFQTLLEIHGDELFNEAKRRKKEDLLVYFALGLFEKRKAYSKMPRSMQLDIKYFFSKYSDAVELAREILFSVGTPEIISENSEICYEELQIGELIDSHSWALPINLINQLSPELRIYVGCATQLYGDIDEFHLIKIHFRSGKVSLMKYDDWDKDEPLLIERIKIMLRELDIDFFMYGDEYEPPPLENKSLFEYEENKDVHE